MEDRLKKSALFSLTFVLLCLFFAPKIFSQSGPPTLSDIEALLGEEKYAEADKLAKQRIAHGLEANSLDSLDHFIIYVARAVEGLKGAEVAKTEITGLLQQLRNRFPYAVPLVRIHTNVAYFMVTRDNKFAYTILKGVDDYFIPERKRIAVELPGIYYDMGTYAMEMGDYALARSHLLQSIGFLNENPVLDKEQLVKVNHSMGMIMWNSSKLDSSIYYWDKAVTLLEESTPDDAYHYYRLATVQNGLGVANSEMGRSKEAIRFFTEAADNVKRFLESPDPHPRKENAAKNILSIIDNLGSLYSDNGDMVKATNFFQYSYAQKKNRYGNEAGTVAEGLINLAALSNNKHEFGRARAYSTEAIKKIRENELFGTAWEADAYANAAIALFNLKQPDSAFLYFEKADEVYKEITGGNLDKVYLNFLANLTDSYVADKQPQKAIATANYTLQYLGSSVGENSLRTVENLKTLINAQYHAELYREAEANSTKGLKVLNDLLAGSEDVLDSMRVEMEIPAYVYFKTKSTYELLPKKDTLLIKSLLAELTDAVKIYEKRRIILAGEQDKGALLDYIRMTTDFIKQLNFELLDLSGDTNYIDDIMGTHESSVYTRIRSRMDRQKAIRFAHLPENVQQEESKIKERLQTAFKGSGTPSGKMNSYLENVGQWNAFQQMLKTKYPDYYNMRYGATTISVKEWSKDLALDITVIRYFFADEKLFALVATNQKQVLVPLSPQNIADKIITLNADPDSIGTLAFDLYQQLWRPLEKEVATKRVIIIPDGILYHLSFEMLSPVSTQNYAEFSKNCLLHKHAISYHYSMLTLRQQIEPVKMKDNFIAFAPGFSERAKQQYLSVASGDSLYLDKAYLSLLPLPFTGILVDRIKKKFGGRVFSGNRSTPDAFREESAYHHIIHIGTHAEANNDYPEYSRLIFAKDSSNPKGENSVYLYDIYNFNLTSDLAVLTACESGKPGYQDGEGMISMAHAFNYAGSRSIMTGLWKLDEQATTRITDYFYSYLNKGQTKDEALRRAKLTYLQNAEGRMVSPTYWAGLVLMGDVEPVDLSTSSVTYFLYLGLPFLVLLLLGGWWFGRRKVK